MFIKAPEDAPVAAELTPETITGSSESSAIAFFLVCPCVVPVGAGLMKLGISLFREFCVPELSLTNLLLKDAIKLLVSLLLVSSLDSLSTLFKKEFKI